MSTPESDEPATTAPSEDRRIAQGRLTRARLVAAATEVLRENGFAATSMRAVAERADAQLSLVHYHFGSKSGLLLAVLGDHTERLHERQYEMFNDGRSFAAQWQTACDNLREDVNSGYVRILWELWAAGLADPDLAAAWRATLRGWRGLITVRLERLQTEHGVKLPMRPAALAALICNLFEGAETEILAGVLEDESPHFEALNACAALITDAEAAAAARRGRVG